MLVRVLVIYNSHKLGSSCLVIYDILFSDIYGKLFRSLCVSKFLVIYNEVCAF